jgi:hypothetical protein
MRVDFNVEGVAYHDFGLDTQSLSRTQSVLVTVVMPEAGVGVCTYTQR